MNSAPKSAILPEYLAGVAAEMRNQSAAIRRDFASHHLSAGENRQDIVGRFLEQHLPRKFGVRSGMVISSEGEFSSQADLLVVDVLNNAPLYGGSRNELWPVEAVYGLVEVKTMLSPQEMADAIKKGRAFKRLQRRFCLAPAQLQPLAESLFVIWGFDCPASATFQANYTQALKECPRSEQPDLLVVPDRVVARAGTYLELAKLGQPGSPQRARLHATHGPSLEALMPKPAETYDLGENALLAWYVWFDSWLRQAGPRLTDPVRYLPIDRVFGKEVL